MLSLTKGPDSQAPPPPLEKESLMSIYIALGQGRKSAFKKTVLRKVDSFQTWTADLARAALYLIGSGSLSSERQEAWQIVVVVVSPNIDWASTWKGSPMMSILFSSKLSCCPVWLSPLCQWWWRSFHTFCLQGSVLSPSCKPKRWYNFIIIIHLRRKLR